MNKELLNEWAWLFLLERIQGLIVRDKVEFEILKQNLQIAIPSLTFEPRYEFEEAAFNGESCQVLNVLKAGELAVSIPILVDREAFSEID
jgi:hypothetical protein